MISNEIAAIRNKTGIENSLRGYLQKAAKESSGTLFSASEQTDELIKVSHLIEGLQKEVYNKSTQHWFEYMIMKAAFWPISWSRMIKPG
ncbi:MAG: hypothetical protein WDO16_17465 [Bacteroidota bacterium]